MNESADLMKKHDRQRGKNGIALKGGSYSIVITVVVLAILIAVNILVSALPKTLTKYDISAAKLYSITSNTKVVVNSLDKDVTIYWIVQSGKENEILENLLGKYTALSNHIKVVRRNPDVYPTFAEKYTDEEVQNNSLVVECGERSRYISYTDIYLQEADMGTYSYKNSFDGEGAITSAIDYVVNEEQPKLYLLTGHGEAEFPEQMGEQIKRANIDTVEFSLLTADAIPEDAACVMIYAPASDISDKEKDMLAEYVKKGGKLLVMASVTKDGTLTNLNSLLSDYGVTVCDGVVVEDDRMHFGFGVPSILLPDMAESKITTPLIEKKYFAIMPVAQGFTVDESKASGVTKLLTTSETAFSKKAGFDLSTYDKEEGDIDGPFALALSIDCGNGGEIIWFGSSVFLNEMYNAYSSGANLELAMNAMSSLIGEREAIAIRSKSLDYNYLTINDSTASFLRILMIGIFPICYLGIGVAIVIRRRKQNG